MNTRGEQKLPAARAQPAIQLKARRFVPASRDERGHTAAARFLPACACGRGSGLSGSSSDSHQRDDVHRTAARFAESRPRGLLRVKLSCFSQSQDYLVQPNQHVHITCATFYAWDWRTSSSLAIATPLPFLGLPPHTPAPIIASITEHSLVIHFGTALSPQLL